MTPWERADRAKQLLADDVLRRALSEMREGLVQKLEVCPIGDIDTQHEVALTLQLLRRFTMQLERYIQDGAVEQHREKQRTWVEKLRAKVG